MILHRTSDPSPIRNRFHLATLLMCLLFLHGCAVVKERLLKLGPSGHFEDDIERIEFLVDEGEDVIGRLAVIRIEKGDTLPDIARHYSLGINSVRSANPGVDVWVPEAGDPVLLPLSFILPDTSKKGIVINLAAMRLFSLKEIATSWPYRPTRLVSAPPSGPHPWAEWIYDEKSSGRPGMCLPR